VQAAAPVAPPVDPVIGAVRIWFAEGGHAGKSGKDDVAAAVAYYAARTGGPLWVDAAGFNARAKAAIAEVRKADDWGLEASAFDLPADPGAGASADVQAAAEGRLTLELLRYARYARGGRVNPASLSRILDQTPPIKDPNVVLTDLAASQEPDAYLRGLHPKHPQFELLRKALLEARGPAKPETEIDPALKVRIPDGKGIKPGVDHPTVALLRQRLKVPAEAGVKDTFFDDKLKVAVEAYQLEKGIKATGQISNATRAALNREVDALKAPDPGRKTQLIVLNMERWRWLPEDMGRVYVQNNIPEYVTRVFRGGEQIFKEKIIVGMPEWATPVFSANMQYISFNPSWGMPDGIKQRELAPRLRSAGGGFLFFGGGGGNIIRAYGLNVYRQGKQVDPDSVDWSNADLRNYSFVQPPGGKNPLGIVKFRFPNKYDVYMHDTIERDLFNQSTRALSHGCIRVQNPRQFAAVVLAEGNGLSAEQAASAMAGGGDITLKYQIPVHMTYFTAMADESGRVSTFPDLYGHDSKLSAALTGRALKTDPSFEPAPPTDDIAYAGDSEDAPPAAAAGAKQKKKKKQSYGGPDTLADAISGFWMN
jgi:murein L,D-transpeptidase YcbB/YkuD